MGEIILYSTNCPFCRQLKMMLDINKIPYIENADEDYMIAEGFSSVPILEVNGERMVFSEAVEWVKNRKGGTKSEEQ